MLSSEQKYRPEIDGLRAVAVLLVVFYHAGFGVPGGFIGVDVFFVISGFLITSLIVKDIQGGRFSLVQFWERRARRILPALFVVVIAILVAGWFLLLPSEFEGLGRAAAAQALFSANFHFWIETGYFAGPAEQEPLLHTWSLAVEEQFYIGFPILLLFMFRRRSNNNRSFILIVLIVGLIASLALSEFAVARHPSAAFYLLPTRAWELLLGSILVFLPAFAFAGPKFLRELLCVTGLSLILVPACMYQSTTLFPGFAALLPCLGAALVIWSNQITVTIVGRALSTRPVVFIGLISYSLYLWHWPFLAFSKYWSIQPLSASYRLVMLALGLICAVLSWKFVEMPFRRRQVCASRRGILTFAGTGLATVFVIGIVILSSNGVSNRFSKQVAEYAAAKRDHAFLHDLTTADILAGNLVRIGVTGSNDGIKLLVWGDSHAMAALPAFDALCKEKSIAARAATHVATAPVLGFFRESRSRFGLGRASLAYNEAVLSYIQANEIPDVVLVANWLGYARDKGMDRSADLEKALLNTVERLIDAETRVWILLQIPAHAFDVPTVLARAAATEREISAFCAKPDNSNGLSGDDMDFHRRLAAAGARILDPRPRFLDPSGSFYIVASSGSALYVDTHHLSTKGAEIILLPLLREAFINNTTPGGSHPRTTDGSLIIPGSH